MKYKVKNVTTGEETLCEKVVMDRFEYYVIDGHIDNSWKIKKYTMILSSPNSIREFGYDNYYTIIATTNPSLDLPMVVDKVELLYPINNTGSMFMANTHELNNSHRIEGYNKAKETYQFTKEDMVEWFNWCENHKRDLNNWKVDNIKGSELFDIDQLFSEWQEQRTITINVK